MDSSIVAAISAILGTTVGGLSTFATTLLNQRYAMRRDLMAKDLANREQLYSNSSRKRGTFTSTRLIEPSTTRPSSHR
jgi:hypothetical protein